MSVTLGKIVQVAIPGATGSSIMSGDMGINFTCNSNPIVSTYDLTQMQGVNVLTYMKERLELALDTADSVVVTGSWNPNFDMSYFTIRLIGVLAGLVTSDFTGVFACYDVKKNQTLEISVVGEETSFIVGDVGLQSGVVFIGEQDFPYTDFYNDDITNIQDYVTNDLGLNLVVTKLVEDDVVTKIIFTGSDPVPEVYTVGNGKTYTEISFDTQQNGGEYTPTPVKNGLALALNLESL